jgi:hypothetical protein
MQHTKSMLQLMQNIKIDTAAAVQNMQAAHEIDGEVNASSTRY